MFNVTMNWVQICLVTYHVLSILPLYNKIIPKLSGEIANLRDENIQAQSTLSSLRDSCKERDIKISHLERTIEERDEALAKLESQYEILSGME